MIQMTPCDTPLPELEIPMINTMVSCLGTEHKKLNDLDLQLAFAATRLARDTGAFTDNDQALQIWDEIRQDLWSHLQIEDELVFSWGNAHHAIPNALLDTLNSERQEMRRLMTAVHAMLPSAQGEPRDGADPGAFAQTMLALARTLDSHVERYDGEVLPSILRALFHQSPCP
jgi:hypothetical protein